jgi:hypothetical protein
MDSATLDKEINHEPGFFAGWNGAGHRGRDAGLGDKQSIYVYGRGQPGADDAYGGVAGSARQDALSPFNESYGKITQPAYSTPATPPATGSHSVAAVVTKLSITHFGAERDEYFSPRVYVLAQAAFDHNYSGRTCNCSKSTVGAWDGP